MSPLILWLLRAALCGLCLQLLAWHGGLSLANFVGPGNVLLDSFTAWKPTRAQDGPARREKMVISGTADDGKNGDETSGNGDEARGPDVSKGEAASVSTRTAAPPASFDDPDSAPSPLYKRYVPDQRNFSDPPVTLDVLCLGPHVKPVCDRSAICELNVMYLALCDVTPGDVTHGLHGDPMFQDRTLGSYSLDARSCARRIGVHRLRQLLSKRCTDSEYWKSVESAFATVTSAEEQGESPATRRRGSKIASRRRDASSVFLHRKDTTFLSQTFSEEHPAAVVPAEKRPLADYGAPRRCSNGCRHYPAGFFIPRANVVPSVTRRKLFGFLPYVPGHFPGDVGSYKIMTYSDEWLSMQLHRSSYFAFTHRRGGFECMRHHEILSNGVVPYYVDLKLVPERTLRHLPKALIWKAMTMPGVRHVGYSERESEGTLDKGHFFRSGVHIQFRHPAKIDFAEFDKKAYFDIADDMLEHVKRQMTSLAFVSYMLRIMEVEQPKHVLVVARSEYDYIQQTVEDGLSDLGIKTTVVGHRFPWVFQRSVSASLRGGSTDDAGMALTSSRENPEGRGGERARTSLGDQEMVGQSIRASRRRPQEHASAETEESADLPMELREDHSDQFRRGKIAEVSSGRTVAGLAWFYGFRVDPRVVTHVPGGSDNLSKLIRAGEFDVVIYAFVERHQQCATHPYWGDVTHAIPKSRRAFIMHDDDWGDPDSGSMDCCQHGFLFKREMKDIGC